MQQEQLVGTWKLLSYETQTATGKRRQPFGGAPCGYLLYTDDGFMSVAMMPARRHMSRLHKSIAEPHHMGSWRPVQRLLRLVRYVLASTRYVSYSGRYSVEGDTVSHHVDVSSLPGWVNSRQERVATFEGNRLILSAVIDGARQRVVWESTS